MLEDQKVPGEQECRYDRRDGEKMPLLVSKPICETTSNRRDKVVPQFVSSVFR